MPELADLADEQFIMNHCFDFGGTDVVEGDTLIRIDFIPAPSVHDPDVAGAVFLDRTSYQLRRMELNLVNLSRPLCARIDGQSIRAEFRRRSSRRSDATLRVVDGDTKRQPQEQDAGTVDRDPARALRAVPSGMP